jgi:hypothetical protein
MKMRTLAGCLGGLAIFLALGNQSSAATINQIEWRQQARIWRGFRSGDLTRQEFRQLERHRPSSIAAKHEHGVTVISPQERGVEFRASKTAPIAISSVKATTVSLEITSQIPICEEESHVSGHKGVDAEKLGELHLDGRG